MKLHNIILRVILVLTLTGVSQMSARDIYISSVEEEKTNKGKQKKISSQSDVDFSKSKKIIAKVDKCFGEGGDKIVERFRNNKNLDYLNVQQLAYGAKGVNVSKLQLFLLYSSLKVDC